MLDGAAINQQFYPLVLCVQAQFDKPLACLTEFAVHRESSANIAGIHSKFHNRHQLTLNHRPALRDHFLLIVQNTGIITACNNRSRKIQISHRNG